MEDNIFKDMKLKCLKIGRSREKITGTKIADFCAIAGSVDYIISKENKQMWLNMPLHVSLLFAPLQNEETCLNYENPTIVTLGFEGE